MRTLNELYLILWEDIKDLDYIEGICGNIYSLCRNLLITIDEMYLLIKHFQSQKPNKELHSEFLESETWLGSRWWWNGKEDYNPINRKAFIKKMIEITK